MPRPKTPKASAAPVEIAPVTALPAAIGFIPRPAWRRRHCQGVGYFADLAPADGAEHLWADIRTDLTVAELDAIPVTDGTTFSDIWPHLLRDRIIAWNVTAVDVETGERGPVPPPAEGGIASLRAAPKLVTEWLALELKFGGIASRARPLEDDAAGDAAAD